jgi:hypothetical protein
MSLNDYYFYLDYRLPFMNVAAEKADTKSGSG